MPPTSTTLPTLLVTHGRDQRWQVELQMKQEWTNALRSGLKRVHAPFWETIPVAFAFYGDLWRDDAERSAELTKVQVDVARDLLGEPDGERFGWDNLADLIVELDRRLKVGKPLLERFLRDLDAYFDDPTIRRKANERVVAEAREIEGDIILLGHSMGSMVGYLTLLDEPAPLRRVRGFLTFGSPAGMPSMYARLEQIAAGTPFPPQPARWVNAYNRQDFATVVRELAPLFPARGRTVEDVETKGRPPSPRNLGGGHDPLIYLTSMGLARALRTLIEDRQADDERSGSEAQGPAPARPRARPGARAVKKNGGSRSSPKPSRRAALPDLPTSGGDVDRGGGSLRPAPPPRRAVAANGGPRSAPTRSRPPADDAGPELMGDPTTDAAGQMRRITRTASADFPPVVAPDSEKELLFAIAPQAVFARSTELGIEVPLEVTRVDLRIGVYAPDFTIRTEDGKDQSWVPITLDLTNPDERKDVRFRLRAPSTRRAMDSTITVTVYKGSLPLGQVELRTRIDPRHVAPGGRLELSFNAAPDPDFTLIITDRSRTTVGKGPFDLRISREGEYLDKPLGEFRVGSNSWAEARKILQRYRSIRNLRTRQDRVDAAKAIGVDLWWRLPKELHEVYWNEIHDRDEASIAIYSQEPYIPWELVVPQRRLGSGRVEKMLGVAHSVARWKQGRSFPDPLRVSGFSVVAPVYEVDDLPMAQREAEDLVAGFSARVVRGRLADVRKLFRSQGVQLIHFAGHGSYNPDNEEDSSIRLADGSYVPRYLVQASIGQRDHPFVVLNACQVGEMGWDLTQIGGWAEAFCAVGFSGFVGPYWKVSDAVARKAAGVLYGELRAGQTVGQAVRKVRAQFEEDDEFPAHPSWLAYTLHCQPNVHIELPDQATT